MGFVPPKPPVARRIVYNTPSVPVRPKMGYNGPPPKGVSKPEFRTQYTECEYCGRRLLKNDRECSSCGAPVSTGKIVHSTRKE